jgi:pimeloyl-ACP methyl ester carboxylesterase
MKLLSGLALELTLYKIKPSTSLDFHPCFGEYECARLDVPLDWTASASSQSKQRAAVAITRFPAKVPVTSARYGGAILLNPGGPGGSGVSLVTAIGPGIQTVVDTGKSETMAHNETKGLHYDIIGFDPRGINNTTPSATCFPDDASREFWAVQNQAQGILHQNDSFPAVWGRTQALAGGCSERLKSEGVGMYMNTPVVANDMVAIIEALGEWRDKEAQSFVKKTKCMSKMRDSILERTKWRKGEEKLLYWGFSYGTLLGATFASMYPSKVGRLVLDGVVDAEDYYAGESPRTPNHSLPLTKSRNMALQPRRYRFHCRKFLFPMLRCWPREMRTLFERRNQRDPKGLQRGP